MEIMNPTDTTPTEDQRRREEIQFYAELGIDIEELNKPCDNIDDLLTRPTGMVMAEALKDFKFTHKSEGIPPVLGKKGDVFVMTLGEYTNLKRMGEQKKDVLFKPAKCKFNDSFKRYRGEDLNGKKLLVWRYGGLGDLIVIQSLLKRLRELYPDAEINFATGPQNILMMHSWPKGLVNKAFVMPFQKEAFDYHDYHLTFINSIENCEEKRTNCYSKIFQKVSNVYYDIEEKYRPTLNIIPEIVNRVKQYIPDNMVLLHMKSTSPLRSLSLTAWKNIIFDLLEIGYKVGIIDSLDSAEELDKLIEALGFNKNFVINLSKMSIDINFGIAITSLAKGVICIDSGILHIAGALKKPTVCFYGAFPDRIVNGGLYTTVKAIEPDENWNICGKFPCYLNNKIEQCPYISYQQSPGCLSMVNHEDGVKVLDEMIKNENN